MHDRDAILNFVIEHLSSEPKHKLLYLIEYGSRIPGHDIDIVAIFKKAPPRREVALGQIDMVYYTLLEVREYTKRMDLLITEPILYGKLIWGDHSAYHELKEIALSTKPTDEVISYLLSKCFNYYDSAKTFLSQRTQNNQDDDVLLWALINLSFSCAYLSYAKYYSCNHDAEPISLDKLTSRPQASALLSIRQYLRSVRNQNEPIKIDKIFGFLRHMEAEFVGK